MQAFTTHVQLVDGAIWSIDVGANDTVRNFCFHITFRDNGAVEARKLILTRNGGTVWRRVTKVPADLLALAEEAARASALAA